MLHIIRPPILTPPMFRKRIHRAPGSNHDTVKELLAPSLSPQPRLPNEEEEEHQDPVADEGGSHYEVCETLPGVFAAAEAEGGDPAKQ